MQNIGDCEGVKTKNINTDKSVRNEILQAEFSDLSGVGSISRC